MTPIIILQTGDWVVPPRNAGQIVEVAYALAVAREPDMGPPWQCATSRMYVVRRTTDGADGRVLYDAGIIPDDVDYEPQERPPRVETWRPCQQMSPGEWLIAGD